MLVNVYQVSFIGALLFQQMDGSLVDACLFFCCMCVGWEEGDVYVLFLICFGFVWALGYFSCHIILQQAIWDLKFTIISKSTCGIFEFILVIIMNTKECNLHIFFLQNAHTFIFDFVLWFLYLQNIVLMCAPMSIILYVVQMAKPTPTVVNLDMKLAIIIHN